MKQSKSIYSATKANENAISDNANRLCHFKWEPDWQRKYVAG